MCAGGGGWGWRQLLYFESRVENCVSLRHKRGYTQAAKLGHLCVCEGVAGYFVHCFYSSCVGEYLSKLQRANARPYLRVVELARP